MKKTHIEASGCSGCILLAAIAAVPIAIAWGIIQLTTLICQ